MTDITAPAYSDHKDALSGEDSVKCYIQDIRRYPRLTREEELSLAKKCAQGDPEAVRQMVVCNLQLVVSVAREYTGSGVPLLDLIQEGSIGLISAAEKFDYTRNLRFSTYATKWIRQGISRCVMEHSAVIRVPHYTAERMQKIRNAEKYLLQKNGTQPSAGEIAQYCDMDEKKVQQLLQCRPQVCSLDVTADEEGKDALHQFLQDAQAPQPYEEMVRRELKSTMDLMLSQLTERQQEVLRLRYGLTDGQCRSMEETGKMLGICKERVRQIENRAMEKLKNNGAYFGLEDFLGE